MLMTLTVVRYSTLIFRWKNNDRFAYKCHNKNVWRTGGVAQAAENLPSKCSSEFILKLLPSPSKKDTEFEFYVISPITKYIALIFFQTY
jgi:hypothetical protein